MRARDFWEQLVAGRFRVFVSRLTIQELNPAPARVRELFESLPDQSYTVFEVTPEVQALADRYVQEGIVGPAYRTDAVHVAVATIAEAKAIVSWNYKHLVNLRKIEAFNGINLLTGYRSIDIRTPAEVIEA